MVRQEQRRDAVRQYAGRHCRHGCHRLHRLGLRGRRPRAVERVLPEGAEAQPGRVPEHPAEPAGARLVQAADQGPRRLQGHEVPPDRHRRRSSMPRWAWPSSTCRAARSCPPPSAAPSIAPSGSAASRTCGSACTRSGSIHYTPGMHESASVAELAINKDVWDSLPEQNKEAIKSATSETFLRWWASFQRQNADAIDEFAKKHGVKLLTTPPEINQAFLKTWDEFAAAEVRQEPVLQEGLRVAEGLCREGRAGQALHVPALRFAGGPLLARQSNERLQHGSSTDRRAAAGRPSFFGRRRSSPHSAAATARSAGTAAAG